jgi:hypothetical protein
MSRIQGASRAALVVCLFVTTAAVTAGHPVSAKAADTIIFSKPVLARGFKAPHTSWGAPDLMGDWSNATTSRLERDAKLGDKAAYTKAEAAKIEGETDARNRRLRAPTDASKAVNDLDECQSGAQGPGCGYNAGWTDPGDRIIRVHGEPRTSMITYPANGRLPARADGKAAAPLRAEGEEAGRDRPGQNDNPEGRSLGERCIFMGTNDGPVMQPTLYNNNYQFVQSKNAVAIYVEMGHELRLIRLNSKHRTDGIRPLGGDPIGWSEGDTLVVETTNFSLKQNFRGSSENLKVTERFTRVAKDRLLYQFTIEDPTVWKEAWGGEYEFLPVGLVYEYACHEGNYGLENILAGAREEERQAAEKAKPLAAK